MNRKIKILHIVKRFYAGGAERLLSSLLQHGDRDRYEHSVLSLSDRNERLGDIQKTLNIPYTALEIRHKYNVFDYLKCLLLVRKHKPDIIKTWLGSSNITGGIMGKLLRIPVIWGQHDSRPAQTHNRRMLHLSHFVPERIVCCSRAMYDVCREVGYDPRLLQVIRNGTDTDVFHPQPEGGKRVRRELGIGADTLLIGMVAEYAPLKRHPYFLKAAKHFLSLHPQTQFLLCGKDTDRDNPLLMEYIRTLGLEQHVHLLGIRNDMTDIYAALDINTLASSSESFGLAITEAMACETACVATDVGIMKELLQEVGHLVPVSENPQSLADAWQHSIQTPEAEKQARLKRGRERVMQHYSITKTAKEYDALFDSIFQAQGTST